jgi:hypothetical protein
VSHKAAERATALKRAYNGCSQDERSKFDASSVSSSTLKAKLLRKFEAMRKSR